MIKSFQISQKHAHLLRVVHYIIEMIVMMIIFFYSVLYRHGFVRSSSFITFLLYFPSLLGCKLYGLLGGLGGTVSF